MEEEKKEPRYKLEISDSTARGIEALRKMEEEAYGFMLWVGEVFGNFERWEECKKEFDKLSKLYRGMVLEVIGINLEDTECKVL